MTTRSDTASYDDDDDDDDDYHAKSTSYSLLAETGKGKVTMRWFARCSVSHWSDVENWARIGE